jgi:hypothetical protein
MPRHIVILLTLTLSIAVLRLYGEDKPKGDSRASLADEQDQLLKDFQDLEQKLQSLSARLEKSDRVEDRDRVALLRKALAALKTSNLQTRLKMASDMLHSTKALSTVEINRAAEEQKAAAAELGGLVTILAAEDREMELSRMVQGYGRELEALQDAIRKQHDAITSVEGGAKGGDKVRDLCKAAASAVKEVQTLVCPKDIAYDCPDRANLVRALDETRASQALADTALADGKTAEALEHERKALAVMKTAESRLGEQLTEVRTEQIERLLSTMQSRCQRMFDMQTTVRNGTVAIAAQFNEGGDRAALEEKVQQLADDQDKIALEAHSATRLLEEQASTLALPEIFYQLRRDMISAGTRLRRMDVGVITQAIQQDILDTLRETTDAIKKARRPAETLAPPGSGSSSANTSGSSHPLVKSIVAPRYAIDPVAEMKVVRGVLNRGNQRMDSMLESEKQEFEAWKKRIPEFNDDDVKGRLSKKELEKERKDAHFRELTCALHVLKEQLSASDRSEDREKVDTIERVLKFAEDLKEEENRPAKLLAYLAKQKGFVSAEFDRQLRRNKDAAPAYAALAHRLDEVRCADDQAAWHELTLRTREAQDRLQKQSASVKQLQK